MSSDLFAAIASWMGTYLIHSTVLICGVALVARILPSPHFRETLWKAAILGSVATAGVQTFAGFQSLGGTFDLSSLNVLFADQSERRETTSEPPRIVREYKVLRGNIPELTSEFTFRFESRPETEELRRLFRHFDRPGQGMLNLHSDGLWPTQSSRHEESRVSWVGLALLVVAALSTCLGLMVVVSKAVLSFRLKGRTPVGPGDARDRLERLRRQAGQPATVRLSESPRIKTPIALGKNEICLPVEARARLQPDQIEALLAHELAHLIRRDPFWLTVLGLIRSLLFFQPLNRFALRQWRQDAELICDDWAVRKTGNGRRLAECLAEVAIWMKGSRTPRWAVGISGGDSPLVRRVKRLCSPSIRREPGSAHRFLSASLLLALVVFAPAVSTSAKRLPEKDPGLHKSVEQWIIQVDEASRLSRTGKKRYRL